MSRKQKTTRTERSLGQQVVESGLEAGIPSLADRMAQEDALQEFVQSVPLSSEDAEDFQEALDREGVDPEDETLDLNSHVSPELSEMLARLESTPETDPILSVQQVEAEKSLDLRAPMSDEAAKAVEMLVAKSARTAHLPDPRPRMSQDRLEMRIRIPRRWQVQHPKRPGTIAHENWLLYTNGMTVSAYLASHDRRRARSDLQWDISHDFVYLQTPQEYAAEVALEAEGLEEG